MAIIASKCSSQFIIHGFRNRLPFQDWNAAKSPKSAGCDCGCAGVGGGGRGFFDGSGGAAAPVPGGCSGCSGGGPAVTAGCSSVPRLVWGLGGGGASLSPPPARPRGKPQKAHVKPQSSDAVATRATTAAHPARARHRIALPPTCWRRREPHRHGWRLERERRRPSSRSSARRPCPRRRRQPEGWQGCGS